MVNSSQTQTVQPNRVHDYLYDSNYTVSSLNDHIKAYMKAQTHQLHVNPIYGNMFSSLQHYPQSQYKLRPRPLMQGLGLDRRTFYRGKPVVAGMVVMPKEHFMRSPDAKFGVQMEFINPDVTGQSRYKYFKRPIIPYLPSLGGQVVYAKAHKVVNEFGESMGDGLPRPGLPVKSKTIGIQTMFRESYAQTDAYSPEYVLTGTPHKSTPELLALVTLTYGAGLPVRLAEIEMIERARTKRAWEADLPKVVDNATFEKRLKMMEKMEMMEWKEREDEIKRIQEARLQILAKVIKTREAENEQINTERVEKIWNKKLQERQRFKEKLQQAKIKALRKLRKKRDNVENKLERRDIIAEYANYGSKIYAPKVRDGVFVDKLTSTIQLNIDGLESCAEIEKLEAQLPETVFYADVNVPTKEVAKNAVERLEMHMQDQLKIMDLKLKDRKKIKGISGKNKSNKKASNGNFRMHTWNDNRFPDLDAFNLKFAQKIEKPPVRPKTPTVDKFSELEDSRENAAITLQKLLRGRIAQNIMYTGKERRLQLISELRTRQKILNASEDMKTYQQFEGILFGDQSLTEMAIENEELDTNKATTVVQEQLIADQTDSVRPAPTEEDAAAIIEDDDEDFLEKLSAMVIQTEDKAVEETKLESSTISLSLEMIEELSSEALFEASIQSEYVGKTLDFLTKELVRLREERKIAAMVMLAERTRKLREAEESGKRVDELERRNVEDRVFRQLIKVNQETVDSYLEGIVAQTIDTTSSIQSRERVKEYAGRLDTVLEELETRRVQGNDGTDNTISDLVSAFLIPEVERQILRDMVEHDQKKFLLAAHKTINNDLKSGAAISEGQKGEM